MTTQKHLRDLLSEEQEPFILQNYIADRRRCHINRWNPETAAAINNVKPGTIASFSGSNLCKSVCFSFPESPDLRRSPVPSLAPPCKTAALLLEAASRIQQKTDYGSAPIKRSLFGSILKRLTQRNRRLKPEISVDRRPQQRPTKRASSIGCTGHSRQSSAWWSESNGERSLGGLDESTSGSDDNADVHRASSVSDGRQDWEFALMNGQLCKSPFRSSGHRSPVFSPPVTPSPFRHGKEETSGDDYEVESPKEGSDEEEQEKEQTSPVSVLDPAAPNFQDEEVVDDDEDGYQDIDDARDRDYNCSYANVQRAKQQLLKKLYRFEKLAELDPIELEKIMLEQDSDDEITVRKDEELSVEEYTIKSRFGHMRKIPSDMRNLVSDLISEEWGKHVVSLSCLEDGESVMKRVCEKIEWWKEVDSDTIDMMVEEDFRRSEIIGAGWKQIAQQQIGDIVFQIEVSIFDSLVTEFFHL